VGFYTNNPFFFGKFNSVKFLFSFANFKGQVSIFTEKLEAAQVILVTAPEFP
jgi:hypothetical protein